MLILDGIEHVQDDKLKDVLVQFRKVQVSRYPIELYKMSTSRDMLGFIDSRFPTDRMHRDYMVACLWVDTGVTRKNEQVTEYVIESRLIRNDKFASNNSEHYIRRTTDPKKFLKHLKEYAKPFSYQEVAMRSMRTAENRFDDWKQQVRRKAYVTTSIISWDDVLEEVTRLKALGIQPQTEIFQQAYEEGVPAYEAYKEVSTKPFKRIHVLLQADGTVAVSSFADYNGIEKGSILYEELSNVPNDIQQQVGMLRMMTSGDFVPNVGWKVNDKEFWVEGLPQ